MMSPSRWLQVIPAARMNVARPGSSAQSASQVARSREVSSRDSYPAERSGRAGDRRISAGRSILPACGAIWGRQLAEDLVWGFAGQGEGIGQRPVRQPGDGPQPRGIREADAQRPGDIQAVRPVLGQPGGRQRGRLQRHLHPWQRPLRVRCAQRGHRGQPGCAPPPEDPGRRGPLRLNQLVHHLIQGGTRCRPDTEGGTGGAGEHRLFGLGQVEHHIGDRPPRRSRRRCPQRLIQSVQNALQPVLLGLEVIEDHHARTMPRPRSALQVPAMPTPALKCRSWRMYQRCGEMTGRQDLADVTRDRRANAAGGIRHRPSVAHAYRQLNGHRHRPRPKHAGQP